MRCSEGLPLFVAWLGDWLHGVLAARDDRADAMPDSLNRLFELELASLAAPDLELIEAASVIGASFATRTLAAVARLPLDEVDRACRRLLRGTGVLVPQGGLSVQRFMFTHVLLRDALYQRIDPERRLRLHGVCADELLASTPSEATAIALHYSAAHRWRDAAAQHVRAGQNAIATHGLLEARGHFEAALAALEHTGTVAQGSLEVDALLGLGHCLVATTGYAAERVGTLYERACTLVAAGGDPVQRYGALNGLATFLMMRGRLAEAARHDAAMFEAASASGDATLLARAHAHRGERYYYEGRLDDAREDMRRAGVLLERGVPDPIGWMNWTRIAITVYEYRALLACELGELDRALAHVDAMFEALARNAHPYSECMAHYFAALTRMSREDVEEAATHVAQMHTLAAEHHYYDLAIWADIIDGHLDCRAGRLDRGLAKLETGLERMDASGVLLARIAVMLLRAEGLVSRGEHREALVLLDDTERLMAQTGEKCREPALHVTRARALEAAREPSVTLALERAYDAATALRSKLWQLRALTDLARLCPSTKPRLATALLGFTEGQSSGVLRAARSVLATA
jgi:tetratricopeptide (TPR) repeat protein